MSLSLKRIAYQVADIDAARMQRDYLRLADGSLAEKVLGQFELVRAGVSA